MTMRYIRCIEKASLVGAFFLAASAGLAEPARLCSPPEPAQPVRVRFVHDGDTLVLTDGRKIRLIGINAPETAHDGQPAEALAIAARNQLRLLLFQHDNRARLLPGLEQHDRHGRELAHLWLPDDTNLTARMLRDGLGWSLTIPPNIRFADCYRDAEATARAASRGVWEQPDYAPRGSAELDLRTRGFLRVRGQVVRVNHGGGALWINLQGHFAIRIPEDDLRWFPQPPDRSWIGRLVEVRGWVYATKGELRVTAHHPAALEVLPTP
jgi:endonuclease YncB( thermonuclease family)